MSPKNDSPQKAKGGQDVNTSILDDKPKADNSMKAANKEKIKTGFFISADPSTYSSEWKDIIELADKVSLASIAADEVHELHFDPARCKVVKINPTANKKMEHGHEKECSDIADVAKIEMLYIHLLKGSYVPRPSAEQWLDITVKWTMKKGFRMPNDGTPTEFVYTDVAMRVYKVHGDGIIAWAPASNYDYYDITQFSPPFDPSNPGIEMMSITTRGPADMTTEELADSKQLEDFFSRP